MLTRRLPRKKAASLRSLGVLGLLLLLWFIVAAWGGWLTAQTVNSWYPTLSKPAWNPPAWVFAPVWTTLYCLLALAGWRLWLIQGRVSSRLPWVLYGLEMGLNVAWSATFFAARNIGGSLGVLLVLWGLAWWMGVCFFRRDRLAGLLLLPYLLWISFALALNAMLWRLNG